MLVGWKCVWRIHVLQFVASLHSFRIGVIGLSMITNWNKDYLNVFFLTVNSTTNSTYRSSPSWAHWFRCLLLHHVTLSPTCEITCWKPLAGQLRGQSAVLCSQVTPYCTLMVFYFQIMEFFDGKKTWKGSQSSVRISSQWGAINYSLSSCESEPTWVQNATWLACRRHNKYRFFVFRWHDGGKLCVSNY